MRNLLVPLVIHDRQFKSGEMRSQTAVWPQPEADVGVLRPGKVDIVRIFKDGWIPVNGTEIRRDTCFGRERDRLDLSVGGGYPRDEWRWGGGAHPPSPR